MTWSTLGTIPAPRTLHRVSYFKAVRLYSAIELCIFTALVVVAIAGVSERAELVLGWTHGVGWILLCIAVGIGCRRGTFPWALLGATVSPLGPVGSTIGLEALAARRRRARAQPRASTSASVSTSSSREVPRR